MVNANALRAWTAAAIPPVATALLQQTWGELVRQACSAHTLQTVLAIACLALLPLAAVIAWPARRATDTSRFVAVVALGETAFFGLAILFHLLAGMIVPSCWR